MRRNTRSNLILAGVVLALIGGVLLVLQREQAERVQPLTTLATGQIRRLVIESREHPTRRFEQQDGRWWMREPYAMPAHADAIGRLLAIANAPVRARYPSDRFDPARIGLQPPRAVLVLDETRIELGGTDAINSDRYLRAGDQIALVPDRFSAWIMAPPESELDHRLAAPADRLTDVRIDGVSQPQLVAAWNAATTSQVARAPMNTNINSSKKHIELYRDDGEPIRYDLIRAENGSYQALRQNPALAYPLDERQVQLLLAELR